MKLNEAFAEFGVGEQITDVVVEEDGVELFEGCGFENRGVLADDGLVSAGLFAHQLERGVSSFDGGMAAVIDVERENQQLARAAWGGRGFGGNGLLDTQPFFLGAWSGSGGAQN